MSDLKPVWSYGAEEVHLYYSDMDMIESPEGQAVEEALRSAPSFAPLKKVVVAAIKRLHGSSRSLEIIAGMRPHNYLSHCEFHAGSQLSKKMNALQLAVFRESGVPKEHVGKFRGHQVDWHKAIVNEHNKDRDDANAK